MIWVVWYENGGFMIMGDEGISFVHNRGYAYDTPLVILLGHNVIVITQLQLQFTILGTVHCDNVIVMCENVRSTKL
jgi:hypothetical protein